MLPGAAIPRMEPEPCDRQIRAKLTPGFDRPRSMLSGSMQTPRETTNVQALRHSPSEECAYGRPQPFTSSSAAPRGAALARRSEGRAAPRKCDAVSPDL